MSTNALPILAFILSTMLPRLLALKPLRIPFLSRSTSNYPTQLNLTEALTAMEERIGRGEGGRGIEDLVLPGDFALACTHLARLQPNSTVVIMSGFPCCVERSPPSETDGPPGAFSVARAVVALGMKALILTDECNEDVFISGASAVGSWAGGGRLSLESFPPESEWTEVSSPPPSYTYIMLT